MRIRLIALAVLLVAGCSNNSSSVTFVSGSDADVSSADQPADAPSGGGGEPCDALVDYLLDEEMAIEGMDPTLDRAQELLADVSEELVDDAALLNPEIGAEVTMLDIDRAYREIDEVTNEVCGVPFISASVSLALAAFEDETDPELPTTLPCFATTDEAEGETGYDYVPVACGTTAAARWDEDLGDWAATSNPMTLPDLTENFESIATEI